jgi:tetratricopeptide (TPR) repeat protein
MNDSQSGLRSPRRSPGWPGACTTALSEQGIRGTLIFSMPRPCSPMDPTSGRWRNTTRRGRARTLLQLSQFAAALREYNELIALEPSFGRTYANLGILYDRMGKYEEAIVDYEQALQLDPELDKGPHCLTRFLRLRPGKPPTIGDRARHLRAQLAKPEANRLLHVPELDATQLQG